MLDLIGLVMCGIHRQRRHQHADFPARGRDPANICRPDYLRLRRAGQFMMNPSSGCGGSRCCKGRPAG